jgi:hypothetical protein
LLTDVWRRVTAATQSLAALTEVELRLANAAAYLEAFGHVVVGWLWLDQAVICETAMKRAGAVEHDFYQGKIAACDFFFGWELPKVDAWLAVLSPVERTPLDTPDAWL